MKTPLSTIQAEVFFWCHLKTKVNNQILQKDLIFIKRKLVSYAKEIWINKVRKPENDVIFVFATMWKKEKIKNKGILS